MMECATATANANSTSTPTPRLGEEEEEEQSGEYDEEDVDYEREVYNYQQQLKHQQQRREQEQLLKQRQKIMRKEAAAAHLQLPKQTSVLQVHLVNNGNNGKKVVKGPGGTVTAISKRPRYEEYDAEPEDEGEDDGVMSMEMATSYQNGEEYVEDEEETYYENGGENEYGEEVSEGDGYENGQEDEGDYYGEEEEEDYPDTLQFCEAQFDDLEDDEEARGLPPVANGNYASDDYTTNGNGRPRITTNAAGIRIVESSTLVSEQDEEMDYEQYQYEPEIQPKVRMNRQRKARPQKIAAELAAERMLMELQKEGYESFKPNILARKLMGVPSQMNPMTRPPPLVQKPGKTIQSSGGISLESILRQQLPSNSIPRLQPRTASSLVMGTQLKIKPNHIPNVGDNGRKFQSQKLQTAPSRSSKLFQQNQSVSSPHPRSILASNFLPNRRPKQSFSSQQTSGSASTSLYASSSARTNGSASLLNSNSNRGHNSIAAIQQQIRQQNMLQMQLQQQTKPAKNVPRCPICKRTFATNQVLQRHMLLHAPASGSQSDDDGQPTLYKCEECFEQFPSPLMLSQHMQSHSHQSSDGNSRSAAGSPNSGAAHRCKVCYRTFTCGESLRAHALMHDGEFKCRACRRGFSDWKALEEHEATHKRYNCQWCEKYFMNSGNLKAHERIHTGERPYKCADCPKAFKQLGGLQYHLKTNPTHKPQKYSKHDAANQAEAETDDGAYKYSSYDEYDNGDGILNMSLADLAAANGL